MKNIITYYYNIIIDNYTEKKDATLIESSGSLYIVKIVQNLEDFNNVLSIIDGQYYIPIPTKDGKNYFEYNDKTYTLFKVTNPEIKRFDNFIITLINSEKEINYSVIWENNIEYFIKEIKKLDHKNIEEITYLNYYLGLSENAIAINELANAMEEPARKCLSHYRITYLNYDLHYKDPTELMIDYVSRDIAEYTKTMFFNGEFTIDALFKLINRYNLNNREILYLLARLLYPNYFFDAFSKDATKIAQIIEKRRKYEIFLSQIIKQIKTPTLNIDISWLN